jgi:hypothetical protein
VGSGCTRVIKLHLKDSAGELGRERGSEITQRQFLSQGNSQDQTGTGTKSPVPPASRFRPIDLNEYLLD